MKLIHQVIKIRSIRTSPSLINKLKNMETKELKIQAPKGYEIDKENSTFECIKFKLINKNITYKDVCANIFNEQGYYINSWGIVKFNSLGVDRVNGNNATNESQLKRLLALNQLLNIAEYYNRNATEFDVKYHIYYNIVNCCYRVVSCNSSSFVYSLETLFNKQEDAQAVVDNPNFRDILDTIYK